MILGQDMDQSQLGVVLRCQVYGHCLGMLSVYGTIDCKDYTFDHELTLHSVLDDLILEPDASITKAFYEI
jgi:hypothetical protein